MSEHNDRTVAVVEIDGHVVASFENNCRIEFENGRLRLWHTAYGSPRMDSGIYGGTLYVVLHNDGRTFTISGRSDPDYEWEFAALGNSVKPSTQHGPNKKDSDQNRVKGEGRTNL